MKILISSFLGMTRSDENVEVCAEVGYPWAPPLPPLASLRCRWTSYCLPSSHLSASFIKVHLEYNKATAASVVWMVYHKMFRKVSFLRRIKTPLRFQLFSFPFVMVSLPETSFKRRSFSAEIAFVKHAYSKSGFLHDSQAPNTSCSPFVFVFLDLWRRFRL